MCDFAADAKAAEELMVGRTLTVARVRELNAKDYFYQMLKDNPEMLKIYPGIENELLQGAIDCHIHAYPDFVHRSQDMIQIAIEASKCGMRAIAFKDHWNISATSAHLTQRHIDDLVARGELTHRVEVYGGVGMCFGMRRIRPCRTAVSEFQNDLVSDVYVVRLLAGRGTSRSRRRPLVQRRRSSAARSETDHGNGSGEKSRHRLRPYGFTRTVAPRSPGQRRRRARDIGSPAARIEQAAP